MQTPLAPTIWRTCRILANARRLTVFAHVVQTQRTSVTQTATACNLPISQACLNLRALQSRGLLAVERTGRWVYYSPQAEPSVQDAAALLRVMTAALRRHDDTQAMLAALTACTHPRRLLILQALRTQPLTAEQLAGRCHISLPAVFRHVTKLLRRGAITQDGVHKHYHLSISAPPLLADLLALITTPD